MTDDDVAINSIEDDFHSKVEERTESSSAEIITETNKQEPEAVQKVDLPMDRNEPETNGEVKIETPFEIETKVTIAKEEPSTVQADETS
jgi:hypothetical protein